MKSLQERQADRVLRKVENALMDRINFDPGRGGVGKVDRRYMSAEEADAVDAATNAAISRATEALGMDMPIEVNAAIEPARQFAHKIKLGGF